MFTHDDAFAEAFNACGFDGSTDALLLVFARMRKSGAIAVETAWRTIHAAGGALPPWDERDIADEIGVTIFVAVAAALIPIADKQHAAFEQMQRALQAEAQMSATNRRRAERREKKAARLAKRPEAIRKYLAVKAANAAARKDAKPAPAGKSTGKRKGGK